MASESGWIEHEEVARKEYLKLANENHANLQCSASGLHVNPKFPHLGREQ